MIELGGNIALDGFEEIELGSMVVVKKVVGNYARQMSEKAKGFEKLVVALKKETNEVKATVTISGKETSAEFTEKNLFFALDKALGKLLSELK